MENTMKTEIEQTVALETEVETEATLGDDNATVETTLERPDWLPEKFWDGEKGDVRTESLAKSYAELEKKYGEDGARTNDIPETPEGYEIKLGDDTHAADPEVATKFHKAGFTREQVQMVHDLGVEQLVPVIQDLQSKADGERHVQRLQDHFGGAKRFNEAASQIATWAKANLEEDAFLALSRTFDGVTAMHQMMNKGEPAVIGRGEGGALHASEAQLRTLMRDPRYWREREPSIVAQVRSGYEKLYPEA